MKPLSKRYSQNRRCPTCAKRITNANTIAMCKPCGLRQKNSDPDFRRLAREGQRRALSDPAAYAKKCATLAATRDKAFARPEVMAKLRSNALRLASYRTPENEAKRIAALVEANKRRRLDWLPDEYRSFYFRMIRNGHGFRAPEAKRIVLDQIRAERDRQATALAELSPFERQERALARGAGLIANDQRPSLASPGYAEVRPQYPQENSALTVRNGQEDAIEQSVKTQAESMAA